jgi:hypothetical protein
MAVLPSSDFDMQREVKRFGWLTSGSEQGVYEIHGGCGFSPKLLHCVSQITSCAARLNQSPESPTIVSIADFLLSELREMRQWSGEPCSKYWEDAKAQPQYTYIEWIRTAAQKDYIIDNANVITLATAEAWRIAAIVYLQCRFFR